MFEPNLDRFAWQGPNEKYLVVELPPDCQICGRRMDERFMEYWNGRLTCKLCINELHEESEEYVNHDHD